MLLHCNIPLSITCVHTHAILRVDNGASRIRTPVRHAQCVWNNIVKTSVFQRLPVVFSVGMAMSIQHAIARFVNGFMLLWLCLAVKAVNANF